MSSFVSVCILEFLDKKVVWTIYIDDLFENANKTIMKSLQVEFPYRNC